MQKRKLGKGVVITGASGGLGQATARLLSAQGASVVRGARRLDRIESLADARTGRGGKTLVVTAFLFVLLSSLTPLAFAQEIDSAKRTLDVAGSVILTNKGISIIPTFSLGKPAVVFDMSMGKRNLRFEPQLSFGLDGKPWSFLFWWRYKVLEADRFRLHVGAHPAISFKTTTKNTHFVALNTNLANIPLSNQLTMNVSPQVYYLQMDDDDGFYFTSRFTLAKRDFPVSISALINKTIQTNIPAGEDFLWNVSVMYAFDI